MASLLDAILSWEYVDLADLLPDQFHISTTSNLSNQVVVLPESSWDMRRRKKCQISDIATWVEVYSTYILVLSTVFPEDLLNLVSYQLFIVKQWMIQIPILAILWCRKWAAVNHIRNWSSTNSELYSLAFTGQAVAINWCPVCQIEGGNHTYDGPQFPSPPPNNPPPWPRSFPNPTEPPAKRPSPTHCIINKNGGPCPYGAACKYYHVCSYCFGPHPVTLCPTKPARWF